MMLLAKTALLRANVGAAGGEPSTWNPADALLDTVFTAANTKLAGNGVGKGGARGTRSHTASGKWYFTVKAETLSAGLLSFGIEPITSNLVNGAGDSAAFGLLSNSGAYSFLVGGAAICTLNPSPAAGDVLNWAWDAGTGLLYVGVNGTYYNSSGSSTGSTPSSAITSGVGGVLFPFGVTTSQSADILTLNINPAGTPAGWTNWG
jgi:hypothetical protein